MSTVRHKGLYILPNLFTIGSILAAFLGILWAVDSRFVIAAMAILVSALLDGLDGKVARITKAGSEFGIQMDSLADLVAFGVSPALLIYLWQTQSFGRLGVACSFLFLACGALRLARFNVHTLRGTHQNKKSFVGLPVPAAACMLATLVLFSDILPAAITETFLGPFSLVFICVLALLMVSNVSYASFKDLEFVKLHPFSSTVGVVLASALVLAEPQLVPFLLFLAYLLSGPISFYLHSRGRSAFLRGLSRRKPS
ncbi:MAG: CDP-diacylglycerol--serine O-phosphatidyltransferase [Desulfohalobiaceae bacterium]|nr:CDP-diacylglycerol--serine O-phosphatidyltransferase [Desulfohalobiaceae bacterium]